VADLQEINSALEKIKIVGNRYPEELEKPTRLLAKGSSVSPSALFKTGAHNGN
jgi:hypothetical protein